MLTNYLKLTFRNFKKQKYYAILNIFGLALGVASVIIISKYVIQEQGFDRFYEHSHQIFRLNTSYKNQDDHTIYATTPPPLHEVLIEEVPEVKAATVLFKWGDYTLRPDNNFEHVFRETNVWHAGKDFFKVFNYGWIEGDPETALSEPDYVVLPKSVAIRYFGVEAFENKTILGKSLLGGKDGGHARKITGIIEDQPANSHIDFDILVPAMSLKDIHESQNWSWNIMHTYFRLDNKVKVNDGNLNAVKQKLHQITKKYAIPSFGFNSYQEFENTGSSFEYLIQPLTNIHLHSNLLREMKANGNINYVYTFFIVGIFVLIIAVVNFVNLSTAQSGKRAKEVGVKKVLGSDRQLLLKQFLFESICYAFIAMIIGLGIVELAMLYFGDFFGLFPKYQVINAYNLMVITLGTILLGIVAGLYPAIYLSSFQPAKILKGTNSNGFQGQKFRNGLVIFQLIISTTLIGCTLIVKEQVAFIQDRNLGFDKENVIVIQNDREIDERRLEFTNYLSEKSDIQHVAFSTGLPGIKNFHMRNFSKDAGDSGFGIRWYEGDDNYLNTLSMKILDGRNFDHHFGDDSSAIILNQAAVSIMGLEDPVGKTIIKNLGAPDEQEMKIIGVVEDFNYESLHEKIEPLAIEFLDNYIFKDYITVRYEGNNPKQALASIKEAWELFEPEIPFNHSFLDKDFDRLFKSEIKLSQMFSLFTFLGMLTASLGLVGLAAFMTESRKKEIGIRKVFGANINKIVLLLLRGFLAMSLIGFLIAAPIIYYFMNYWLAGFEYKIEQSLHLLLFAGLISTFIVILTIGYQTFAAARLNPVKSLKEI